MPVIVKIEKNDFLKGDGKLRREIGRANQLTAFAVRDEAKSLVPVETGETQEHIEAIKTGEFEWSVVSTRPSTDSRADVPRILEFGAHNRPATPYMTPAAEHQRSYQIRLVQDAVVRSFS